jgi:hypothetical protein
MNTTAAGASPVERTVRLDPERLAFEDWADERWGREAYRHKSDICDTTPPYPFRSSIEAAHAIRKGQP